MITPAPASTPAPLSAPQPGVYCVDNSVSPPYTISWNGYYLAINVLSRTSLATAVADKSSGKVINVVTYSYAVDSNGAVTLFNPQANPNNINLSFSLVNLVFSNSAFTATVNDPTVGTVQLTASLGSCGTIKSGLYNSIGYESFGSATLNVQGASFTLTISTGCAIVGTATLFGTNVVYYVSSSSSSCTGFKVNSITYNVVNQQQFQYSVTVDGNQYYVTFAIPSPTPSASSSNSGPLIGGVVAGVVILAALSGAGAYYFFVQKAKKVGGSQGSSPGEAHVQYVPMKEV